MQEVAPLSYSFIGGYFLNRYFSRFEEALNLAATKFEEGDASTIAVDPTATAATTTPTPTTTPRKPYSLIRSGNVGYTAILLFARDPEKATNVQQAEVGFGAAEMGNKGAAGLRLGYSIGGDGSGDEPVELTFVATHLAAMEWNLPRRNANWAAIMRGLTFENPEEVLNKHKDGEGPPAPNSSGSRDGGGGDNNDDNDGDDGDDNVDDGETTRLLQNEHDQHHARLQRQIHNLSVYKPTSHLFVAGDLNYRISTVSPRPGARVPAMDPGSPDHYPKFLPLDQLTRERRAGRTLHGLSEAPITFPPTYKYDILPPSSSHGGGGRGYHLQAEDGVRWKFAPHRYPGWTDRVLYLDNPSAPLQVRSYDAFPVVRSSDHRPVYLRISVPAGPIGKGGPSAAAAAAAADADGGDEDDDDPRSRLPIEIDPEAWERRAAARRREVVVGWGMFLWSTREGACILGALLAAGFGAYWLTHRG